jgi:pimeloyl-ACP methyl ester carboxylesterase
MTLESLQIRLHGDAAGTPLVYLPGLHGDWTLIPSFRAAVRDHVRFVEFTYPRTLTWTLDDYARAILDALTAEGIETMWLVAESFGSQVAWTLLKHLGADPIGNATRFHVRGLILAGGFVRHPFNLGVRSARQVCGCAPLSMVAGFLRLYARYARFRHRHAPETMTAIREFVARRTEEDRRAMTHRLNLIAESDPRPIAAQTTLPVYQLSGWFDPVVPPIPVRTWLRRHCPGYRESRIIFPADHNVLGTEPLRAANVICDWIGKHDGKVRGEVTWEGNGASGRT